MIDLTPLDVRKKKSDFRRQMRGYDPSEVDTFLDMVSERLEVLVKENLTLQERTSRLQEQVTALSGREQAVNEALVTAQELRTEIRGSAEREAELLRKEAAAEGRRILEDSDRRVDESKAALGELERRRTRFLAGFRQLLERELDAVAVEEGRSPLEDATVDLDLGGGHAEPQVAQVEPKTDDTPPPDEADVHALAQAAEVEAPEGDPASWLDLSDEEEGGES